MVSYQGFIWPLLDDATYGPCYLLTFASPTGGQWYITALLPTPPHPGAF